MAGPGLAGGTYYERKAILWLSISDHRMGYGIDRTTTARSGHRCTGFRSAHGGDLRITSRLASCVHQHMAAGAAVASF